MTQIIKIFIAISILIGLQSCTNPLGDKKSTIDPGYGQTSPQLPAATGYESVSGSKQSVETLNNKKVDVTVGSQTKEIKLTTANNKQVYLSVQGQMISK